MITTTLRDKRIQHGFSQEGLARACKCTRQTIVNIENGKTEPKILLAMKLARLLHTGRGKPLSRRSS